VVWTDLGPSFEGFTVNRALAFLGAPGSRELTEARTYIALSPAMVETPLRASLRATGWLSCNKIERPARRDRTTTRQDRRMD
jgi:hypothetical protein